MVTNCDHLAKLKFSKTLPHAFTEHGAIQAANVLASAQAVEMGIYVVRAFVKLREAAIEGQKVQRAANRALNEKSLASLKTKGMQINEVSAAEQTRIRAKVNAVYDKHKDSIGADAIKVVQDELKKSRGG